MLPAALKANDDASGDSPTWVNEIMAPVSKQLMVKSTTLPNRRLAIPGTYQM